MRHLYYDYRDFDNRRVQHFWAAAVPIIASVAGSAMSGSKGSSDSPEVTAASFLTPEQQAGMSDLWKYLQGTPTQTLNPAWTAWDKQYGSGAAANPTASAGNGKPFWDAASGSWKFPGNSGVAGNTSPAAPEQYLTSYNNSKLEQIATPYTGDRVAEMSDTEKASLDYLKQYMGSDANPMFATIADTLSGIMKSPADATSLYQKYNLPAAQALFKNDILPTTKEAFAGPGGGYWGSARAEAESKAAQDWGTEQTNQMGKMLLDSMGYANTAASTGLNLASYLQNMPLEKAKAGQLLGALPRTLNQADLDAQYNEFIRVAPESSPWLKMMFDFLGLKTQENAITPGDPSMLSQIMGAVGPAMAGMKNSSGSGKGTVGTGSGKGTSGTGDYTDTSGGTDFGNSGTSYA